MMIASVIEQYQTGICGSKNKSKLKKKRRENSHVQNHHKLLIHMSEVGVAELTWENGYLATHEVGGFVPTAQRKATWVRRDDTLESVVHQATCHNQRTQLVRPEHCQIDVVTKKSPVIGASSDGKWGENFSQVEMALGFPRKRGWSECYNQYDRNSNNSNQELAEPSVCASASATFCRGKDATVTTWDSLESYQSFKSKSVYENSAYLDGKECQETKGEAIQSRSTRRSRVAAVHQSERKRRERINQKMKALQKLVPNASKTDKASMLDEVIMYLKQLQSQVQMMSMRNNIPQMAIPQGMQQQQQQQLQMALLARMGMGIGLGMNMGMLDMNPLAQCLPPLIHSNSATAAAPSIVTPSFVLPQMVLRHNPSQATPTQGASNTSSTPFSDPYSTFLAQSMNMELYNKMAAYHQHVNQTAKALRSDKNSNRVQEQ